jgi:hypothetical protein
MLASPMLSYAVRHFSSRAPRPETFLQKAITTAAIASGVMIPFIPPALESKRERDNGHPNARYIFHSWYDITVNSSLTTCYRGTYAPLCFHAR